MGAPSSNVPINDDEWHQVIVTFVADTDQLDIFVDPAPGATVGQFSGSHDVNIYDEQVHLHNGGIANTSFRIGQVSDNFRSEAIIGLLDEAAVFDVALSGAELDQLISQGPASFIPGDNDPNLLVPAAIMLDPASTATATASRSFPIWNSGASEILSITGLSFSGDDAALFSAPTFPATVPPGASGVIQFDFSPTAPGNYKTTLEVASNDANSPKQIALSVAVVPDPFFTLPNHVVLEATAQNAGAVTSPLPITNTGLAANLEITAISFSGPDAGLFSNAVLPASPIAPGESGTINFDFDSNTAPGDYAAVLEITSNAEDSPTTFVNLNITVLSASKGSLIAYWNFDRDVSDATGNHNGTLKNGATISSGGLGFGGGEALSLEGGSGGTAPHVTTANPKSFDFNNDFTWHAYVKTASAAGGIFGRVPATGNVPNHNQGSKSLFVGDGNAQWDTGWVGAPSSNVPINDDEWHQVIVTFVAETDQLDIFVDPEAGAITGQFSGVHDVNRFDESTLMHNAGVANTSFRIGHISDNFRSDAIVGLIDEAAVFNVALNGSQLDQLIANGPRSFASDPMIAITALTVSPNRTSLTMTWNSRPGETFAVNYSTDLQDWDGDLDDSVLADNGESTTRTFDINGLAGESNHLFVRVVRR